MHFFGITVVIICKFFEVVKSNTIILMTDCNNHLHTFSKKTFVFWISSFLAKTKGGSHLVPKKVKFWANTNFWPMGWPKGSKIVWVTISAILYSHLEGISISIKNKKVMLIESYVMPKNQKSWLPPPPLVLNVQTRRLCPEMKRKSDKYICFNFIKTESTTFK